MELKTTVVYKYIEEAIQGGYTTLSFQGSSRSSKTYNIMIWLIVYCLQHPRTQVSVVRASMPVIRRTVFKDFAEIMVNMGIYNERRLNKTELVYRFDNESNFEFFSVDNEQKIRGAKRNILFINEANEIDYDSFVQLKIRTTQYTILDYNPSFDEEHWINDVNIDKSTFHCITTYKDNPFLEQTVIDEIEKLRLTNPMLWQVYGLGQRAIVEGRIFKDYELVGEIPPNVTKRFIGIDFGYQTDPTAIVEVGVFKNNLYVNEIEYRPKMLTADIVEILKSKEWDDYEVIAESADPRLIAEIRGNGVNIKATKKGSIMIGINKLLSYKWFVTEGSVNLIRELKNYTYMKDKAGKWINRPIDNFNHLMDAIRYVANSRLINQRFKGLLILR